MSLIFGCCKEKLFIKNNKLLNKKRLVKQERTLRFILYDKIWNQQRPTATTIGNQINIGRI